MVKESTSTVLTVELAVISCDGNGGKMIARMEYGNLTIETFFSENLGLSE
jgi:hypothetical protein